MKILITLLLSTLTLFIYVKRSYKYASVNDTVEPPIDYESDKYKQAEVWFTGMGRCWMKREPVFIKPMYKYKGEVKEHTIERLEFRDVPENDAEKLALGIKRFCEFVSKSFNGVGR